MELRQLKTQFFNLIDASQMKHRFDGVLVDASALAGERRNPDAKWRTSSDEIKKFASKQLKILSNASIKRQWGNDIFCMYSYKRRNFRGYRPFLKKRIQNFF